MGVASPPADAPLALWDTVLQVPRGFVHDFGNFVSTASPTQPMSLQAEAGQSFEACVEWHPSSASSSATWDRPAVLAPGHSSAAPCASAAQEYGHVVSLPHCSGPSELPALVDRGASAPSYLAEWWAGVSDVGVSSWPVAGAAAVASLAHGADGPFAVSALGCPDSSYAWDQSDPGWYAEPGQWTTPEYPTELLVSHPVCCRCGQQLRPEGCPCCGVVAFGRPTDELLVLDEDAVCEGRPLRPGAEFEAEGCDRAPPFGGSRVVSLYSALQLRPTSSMKRRARAKRTLARRIGQLVGFASLNGNSWSTCRAFLEATRPGVAAVALQEHRLDLPACGGVVSSMAKCGWSLSLSPAVRTAPGADLRHTSAGVGVAVRKHVGDGPISVDVDSRPACMGGRIAATFVGLLGGIMFLSVYLYHTEGWTHRNQLIMEELVRVVAMLKLPFLIFADWNMQPADLEQSLWVELLKAVVIFDPSPLGTFKGRDGSISNFDFLLMDRRLVPVYRRFEVARLDPFDPHKPILAWFACGVRVLEAHPQEAKEFSFGTPHWATLGSSGEAAVARGLGVGPAGH